MAFLAVAQPNYQRYLNQFDFSSIDPPVAGGVPSAHGNTKPSPNGCISRRSSFHMNHACLCVPDPGTFGTLATRTTDMEGTFYDSRPFHENRSEARAQQRSQQETSPVCHASSNLRGGASSRSWDLEGRSWSRVVSKPGPSYKRPRPIARPPRMTLESGGLMGRSVTASR